MFLTIGVFLGVIAVIVVGLVLKWDLWWPLGIMLVVAALVHG
jgi:hypothetical protein